MREIVDFASINVIPGRDIQIIEAHRTCINDETGMPSQVLLRAAINRDKADSELLTMWISLPVSNYRSKEHQKLLAKFRSGEPFVAVLCEDLKVYRRRNTEADKWTYYANAKKYIVIDYYLTDGGAEDD